MAGAPRLVVSALSGLPRCTPGDDLASLIVQALRREGIALVDGDVLVVSSKVLSKAAGLVLSADAPAVADVADLTDVREGRKGRQASARQRAIERESRRVVAERVSPLGLTQIVESMAGPVMAAAGVDASNTGAADTLLLLPRDADAAAADLLAAVADHWAASAGAPASVGIVISDTAGRPWRVGQTDFALGAAGVVVSEDLRGGVDADGRALQVTERCLADELACAADLVKGKAAAVPVAHVRGIPAAVGMPGAQLRGARSLVRTGPGDWFGLGRAEAVRAALGVEPGSALAHSVGIASTMPEPDELRTRRAIAVALVGQDGTTVEVVPDGSLCVSAADAFDVGMTTARLIAALAGEGLTAQAGRPAAGPSVAVHVS